MSITETVRSWRRYRNTVNELEHMSNRELDDLGIARANIRAIARQGR